MDIEPNSPSSNMVFENNDALKYVLRNQLLRILYYLALMTLIYFLLVYFMMVILNRYSFESYLLPLIILVIPRIENLRALTLFRTIKILMLVEKKDIKWNLVDDELTFGRGRFRTGYDTFPTKMLVCYYDNQVETIKPFVEYQTMNMIPLEQPV